MTPDLDNAAGIKRKIDMGLHTVINGDSAMSQDGFGLVAADAVKSLHNKVKQLGRLLHLAHDSLIVVAGYSVVMTSGHGFREFRIIF